MGAKHSETTAERDAAWQAYVELATRITTAELLPGEGSLRATLTSLDTTVTQLRGIVAAAGPAVSPKNHHSTMSVARTIIGTAQEIAAFRRVWHLALQDWEVRRDPTSVTEFEHERAWPRDVEFRAALAELQVLMRSIAAHLATAAGAAEMPQWAQPRHVTR